jgi:hypothetical protein
MDEHSRFRKRFFAPPIILVAVAASGFVIMSLWNALMPEIFKLPTINFWQALGLFVLARLLLGGFGGPGRGGVRERRSELRHHMRERWARMTPEQREKSRRMWKDRWGFDFEEDAVKEPKG